MTGKGKNKPEAPRESTDSDKWQDGGLEPKDSRNVTGTAVAEDGRWTGASVRPEDGPKVPQPKD